MKERLGAEITPVMPAKAGIQFVHLLDYLGHVRAWVEANGLTLHPDKTHLGDCRIPGQGFDFLGYRFEAGERWVRKKGLMALTRRTRGVVSR